MFTHKMCESCSINIQLSKGLPSPRFLKQFHKAVHIAISIFRHEESIVDMIGCP